MDHQLELKTYSIMIQEHLDAHVVDWIHDMTMLPLDDGTTLLVGTFSDHLPMGEFLAHTSPLEVTVLAIKPIKSVTSDDIETMTTMLAGIDKG